MLSAAIVVVHFARNRGTIPSASPIVTLATFLTTIAIPSNQDPLHLLENGQTSKDQDSQEPCLLDRSITPLQIPFRVPVNLLLVLLLVVSSSPSNRPFLVTAATSVLFVAAQTVVFILIPRLSCRSYSAFPTLYTLIDWDLVEKLSLLSTACFTCLLIYSISISSFSAPKLLSISRAVAESASWISVFVLCTEKLSTTATTFETVATSFDAVTSNDGWVRLLVAFASCIMALWQSVTGIVPSSKSRNWLYLLILIPTWNLGHPRHHQLTLSKQQLLRTNVHPVEGLVQSSRVEFATLLEKQSRSAGDARLEYLKRYGIEPPPKFNKWFELAVQNDFVLVDEFDSMMRAFKPFRGVASSVLQKLVNNAHEQSPDFMLKYEILGGKTRITGGTEASWFAGSMSRLLRPEWALLLPDLTLAVNIYDEPTVCAPRDLLDRVLQAQQLKDLDLSPLPKTTEVDLSHSPRFLSIGKQDAWEAITMSCPVDSPARNPFCMPPEPDAGPRFIRNLNESSNICEHCELQDLEGFFIAPETLHLTHSLAPIWSQGKPSSFNDLIFPSPYYLARNSDYNETGDPEWSGKASQLYWVGAATGGHTTESNWEKMQRQRMVLMTQTGSTKPVQLLREINQGLWESYTSNISEVSSLFSTRVMGVTPQCEHAACEAQKEAFGIADQEVKDRSSAAYQYKFALDLDGNSFSGRFYRLLQSKSMVIKQTVFEEWHNDRIIPWIHYIPVSTGFDELPELMRFLATTENGEEIAAGIARDSREWAGKALRPVDLQLVWLRMLLEYARIMDPRRDS